VSASDRHIFTVKRLALDEGLNVVAHIEPRLDVIEWYHEFLDLGTGPTRGFRIKDEAGRLVSASSVGT
jgi:hypothetical protein